MRIPIRAVIAIGLAAVSVAGGPATASNGDKATGGGQILLASDGRGPGDTIAFTAQARPDGTAHGNLNVIDRTGNTGKGGVHFRGDVTCIVAEGNVAKIAGVGEYKDGTTTAFTLVVTDNGEGLSNNDMIALQYVDDPTCEREEGDDDGQTELARGNAQVRDGD